MPQNRLDPDHPDAVMFGVKLGHTDAEKVIELAEQDGTGKSAAIRALVLDALDRKRKEPGPLTGG